MKLTATMFLSLDGVYQGPGGPDEDRSGGFTRGGWVVPYFEERTGAFVDEVFGRVDAFLIGRRTYDIFAGSWGKMADPGDDPVAVAFNTLPKYVPSTTLTDPGWAGTTVLSDDVAAAVRELKARPGRELQVHGSGELVRWLLAEELLDELHLLVFPVVLGAGRRLFPAEGADLALELTGSRTTPRGVTILSYRTAGRPEYGTIEVE
ncbi:dihydrofolate reductase family protein [Pseudonocardia sp. C8]|uniref:dihydrofolate reductase family protein n=1 Tax=Pseudonocardia sp. C8 TaxID=2762759 RepID=UPI001642E67D|nr:dihydrofolate reductase family protein [Pseudonocardia sp. C8]MBC3192804.1 dihydrofolate reductase family protein [Pseudonocardia sp. C8]